jgi:DNA adenine methylase
VKIAPSLSLPRNYFGITTPLRYPGGKSAISGFLAEIINKSNEPIDTYIEPYAGGAGAAISLLLNKQVNHIVINDLDPAVYCFWNTLTNNPDCFIEKIWETDVTIEEWIKQREIYRKHDMRKKFKLGFAFFFLNRCNRSGIVKGGVIGGIKQAGNYKLNARYKKETLIAKITAIKEYSDCIEVFNNDGLQIFKKYKRNSNALIYLDPPYVEQGKSLYLNAFKTSDHENLAKCVSKNNTSNWIVTYDMAKLITSEKCYAHNHSYTYSLSYSAQNKRRENEYLICSDKLNEIVANYLSE